MKKGYFSMLKLIFSFAVQLPKSKHGSSVGEEDAHYREGSGMR